MILPVGIGCGDPMWDCSCGIVHVGLFMWDCSCGIVHVGLLMWDCSCGIVDVGLSVWYSCNIHVGCVTNRNW